MVGHNQEGREGSTAMSFYVLTLLQGSPMRETLIG